MVKVGDVIGGLRVTKVRTDSDAKRNRYKGRSSSGTAVPKTFEPAVKPEDIVVGSAVVGRPGSEVSATLGQIRRMGGRGSTSRADILKAAQAPAKTASEKALRDRLLQEAKLRQEAARRNIDVQQLIISKQLKEADLNPVIANGRVTGFSSNLTNRTYSYTQEGINQLNKDLFSQSLKPKTFKQILKEDRLVGQSVKKGKKGWYENYVMKYAKNIDKFNMARWNTAKKNLTKFGINVDKVSEKAKTLIKKGVDEQMKYQGKRGADYPEIMKKFKMQGAGTAQREVIRAINKIPGLKVTASSRLANIPEKNRQALAEISARVRAANPNLSEKQIQKKIRKEMSVQTLADGLEGAGLLASTIILSAATIFIEMGIATPTLLRQLSKNPLVTLASLPPEIAKGLWNDTKTVGKIISPWHKGEPVKLAELAGEYWMLGKVFGFLGRGSKAAGRKISSLSPRTFKFSNGNLVIRKAPAEIFNVRGKQRFLKTRVQAPSIKRPFSSVADFLKGRKPGQFKKFTKDPGLILKEQTVSSGAKSLSKQAKLAGREVTAVNAAADQITSWLIRKKLIRKPIPAGKLFDGQIKATDYFAFPNRIGAIMKKFDKHGVGGKKGLTKREFVEVNNWLRKNVAPNITLLERSLYLDPASGLRKSRLGISPESRAGLMDVLRLNFKWRTNKPQVLVFEKAKVANFPKSLSRVKNKLLKGQKLTMAETYDLIRWQIKRKGELTPIGSTIYQGGRELEVTLAPGEFVKRIKQVGRFYEKGRKVTIVSAEIYKPPKSLLLLLKKAREGKLTKSQVKALEKTMSKNLGRKVQVETPLNLKASSKAATRTARRLDPNVPVLRLSPKGLRVLARGRITRPSVRKTTTRRTTTRRTTRKTTTRRTTTRRTTRKATRKKTTRRKPGRPPKRPGRTPPKTPRKPGRPPKRPGRRPPKTPKKPTPVPRPLKGYKLKKLSKPVQTYYVVEKVRGKYKKLYPKPLKSNHARDFAVYSIDNRLSKTAFLVPLGKRRDVVTPPKNVQGYYSANSRKVRPYRIRYGQKKQLVNGYIEKRKYFQDTAGERSQAARLRAKSSSRTRGTRTKKTTKTMRPKASSPRKTKATPAQLRALKKARAARKRTAMRRKKR